ncbi:hypothetical protein [Tomitella biformata]|uniref:hypothetical protein n=1 Tax=Tomitella biformata TaxID=630403 RepID=UPI0004B6C637|nr:hypothetical protein [Tomitella biformata]
MRLSPLRLATLAASALMVVGGATVAVAAPAAPPANPGGNAGGASVLSPIPGQGPATDPVYGLAGGCYALAASTGGFIQRAGDGYAASADSAGAESFRAQAAQLGRFLFFGSDEAMIAANSGAVVASAAAGPGADWTVAYADGAYTIASTASGERLGVVPGSDALVVLGLDATKADGEFQLTTASGCATFPEAGVNATGAPFTGTDANGNLQGYADTHVHQATQGFIGGMVHCGHPYDPLGITVALKDCADHGASGETALLEKILSGDDPLAPHDTAGWPNFEHNPTAGTQTHEQTYYRSVERSWRGGQRIHTNLFVTNDVLCELYPLKDTTCNGMEVMRIQYRQLHDLQDYIDAQYGGPGRGWFRIVTTFEQGREVIESGRLAVVMGVEISDLFGCTITDGVPQCDEADIDAGLDELQELGIQQIVLVHKFDNALGGTRMDSDFNGLAVNIGNFIATGRFWQVEPCTTELEDNAQPIAIPGADALTGALPAGVTVPVYPAGHNCNAVGLTGLGDYAVRGMVDRGITVDLDHLSAKASDQVLNILEETRYPRVISSHSWTDKRNFQRILALGGFVGAYANGMDEMPENRGRDAGFVENWKYTRAHSDPSRLFGFGYGSDTNGFAPQAAARETATAPPVTYPFTAFDGTVLDRNQMGSRTFDINTDGRAQYGLTPDWIEDGRLVAGAQGSQFQADMANGAEAYLRTWEGR